MDSIQDSKDTKSTFWSAKASFLSSILVYLILFKDFLELVSGKGFDKLNLLFAILAIVSLLFVLGTKIVDNILQLINIDDFSEVLSVFSVVIYIFENLFAKENKILNLLFLILSLAIPIIVIYKKKKVKSV